MILKTKFILLITYFVLFLKNEAIAQDNGVFTWFNGKKPITYSITQNPTPVVTIALDMFKDDLQQVTGFIPQKANVGNAVIHIIQLNKERALLKTLRTLNIPVDSITSQKEAFYITISNNQLLVIGSDARGTAYGILELSRLAGVSPWIWWSDVVPLPKKQLTLPSHFQTLQFPSVEYRGIFLNDEDWTLQPWSWKHFEPSSTPGYIGIRTYKEIFKLLLRLRANTIWPGMHGMTTPFYRIPGAKETADSCGIVIGTSHCEPLMRNNVGEWDINRRGQFNYMTNRNSVQNYWIERLKGAGKYENFYTMGMRGIHDGSMEGVKTLREKTDILQQVINDQRILLSKYVNPNVKSIPQTFVPYKEVLQILENGLRVPDDITLVWCDDNYGYMTRLSDSLQQKRKGGAGVYYHLSYWGRPHDYMWLSTIQPGLIYNEMKQAYDHNAHKLWIVNVHDLKTAAYDLELFLDMAWNINTISPSTIQNHQKSWLCREFGIEAGTKLLPVMLEFYRLCAIRKPEFMGWNQVELDKNKYHRGWSPISDTEFSLTEFGGELDHYLYDYESIKHQLKAIEPLIASYRKDAFFSHIKYPVLASAAMATKMLEAQRARSIARADYDSNRWNRDNDLMTACAKSLKAYHEIRQLTNYYNDTMSNGKWKYSMCDTPRDLYVFYAPWLPIGLTDAEINIYTTSNTYHPFDYHKTSLDNYIVSNACNYTAASTHVSNIQSLGHSMNAVSLPKDQFISFDFQSDWEGDALLYIAVIPTQPNDKGDIRFCIQIDNNAPHICSFKEAFRSDKWKENVLRGQAVNSVKLTLTQGTHTLTIKALDDHIVLDQWMIDFKTNRKFYMFPIPPTYKHENL